MASHITPKPITWLLDSDIEQVPSWIEPSILTKGGVFLFGGDSKVGKSFFAIELGRAVATGTVPFGCPLFYVPQPARALYIEQEVLEPGLAIRVKKSLAEDNIERRRLLEHNFWYISGEPELKLDNKEGFKLLCEAIAQFQPNVLILDPVAKFHTLNENSNEDMGLIFDRIATLRKLFADNDMSVVIPHHARKPSGDTRYEEDQLSPHRFRGSSRFFADPDTIMVCERLPRKFEFRAPDGKRAWRVNARWVTRQGEAPDDMAFTVNAKGDLRVRFDRMLDAASPKTLKPNIVGKPEEQKEPKSDGAVQLGFAEG